MPVLADAPDAVRHGGISPRLDFAVRLLGIRRDAGRLAGLWEECESTWTASVFVGKIELLSARLVVFCAECSLPLWADDARRTADDDHVCDACCDDFYSTCYHCEQLSKSTELVDGDPVCQSCLDRYHSWCDDCDRYVDRDHWHECACEARHPKFRFPSLGHGAIVNDSRVEVTLPAGVIDDAGLAAVYRTVHDATGCHKAASVAYALDHQWTTREGTFTKRLSRLLYREHGVKLPPSVLSQVGNLARTHSSDTSTWHIEFTRGLNASAAAFYNEGSCWWGDHSDSRCALKTCGGIGLRSYAAPTTPTDAPNGRAWVIPLDPSLMPTQETDSADAFLVFNEYGALDGCKAARLVAHLTGKSYSAVAFYANPMFVNGETGFLVADQSVCERTLRVTLDLDVHPARWAA